MSFHHHTFPSPSQLHQQWGGANPPPPPQSQQRPQFIMKAPPTPSPPQPQQPSSVGKPSNMTAEDKEIDGTSSWYGKQKSSIFPNPPGDPRLPSGKGGTNPPKPVPNLTAPIGYDPKHTLLLYYGGFGFNKLQSIAIRAWGQYCAKNVNAAATPDYTNSKYIWPYECLLQTHYDHLLTKDEQYLWTTKFLPFNQSAQKAALWTTFSILQGTLVGPKIKPHPEMVDEYLEQDCDSYGEAMVEYCIWIRKWDKKDNYWWVNRANGLEYEIQQEMLKPHMQQKLAESVNNLKAPKWALKDLIDGGQIGYNQDIIGYYIGLFLYFGQPMNMTTIYDIDKRVPSWFTGRLIQELRDSRYQSNIAAAKLHMKSPNGDPTVKAWANILFFVVYALYGNDDQTGARSPKVFARDAYPGTARGMDLWNTFVDKWKKNILAVGPWTPKDTSIPTSMPTSWPTSLPPDPLPSIPEEGDFDSVRKDALNGINVNQWGYYYGMMTAIGANGSDLTDLEKHPCPLWFRDFFFHSKYDSSVTLPPLLANLAARANDAVKASIKNPLTGDMLSWYNLYLIMHTHYEKYFTTGGTVPPGGDFSTFTKMLVSDGFLVKFTKPPATAGEDIPGPVIPKSSSLGSFFGFKQPKLQPQSPPPPSTTPPVQKMIGGNNSNGKLFMNVASHYKEKQKLWGLYNKY